MKFPEWTEQYKSKGIYVGKSREGYFLYKAHCIYDKELKKRKTIIDEYLGVITETEGFIPKRRKFDNYTSLEYGLSNLIIKYFKRDLTRHVYNDSKFADLMVCASIIYYIYGSISKIAFHHSYLSRCFTEIDFSYITDNRFTRIVTLSKNIDKCFSSLVDDEKDRNDLIILLKNYIILFDGKNYEKIEMNKDLKKLLEKYNLEV